MALVGKVVKVKSQDFKGTLMKVAYVDHGELGLVRTFWPQTTDISVGSEVTVDVGVFNDQYNFKKSVAPKK